jgi:hypothetical protein
MIHLLPQGHKKKSALRKFFHPLQPRQTGITLQQRKFTFVPIDQTQHKSISIKASWKEFSLHFWLFANILCVGPKELCLGEIIESK